MCDCGYTNEEMGELREHIDRARILTDHKGAEATLTLRSVSMLYKPFSVFVIILIVIGCIALIFALFVAYLYVAVLIKESKLRRRRREARQDPRASKIRRPQNKKM